MRMTRKPAGVARERPRPALSAESAAVIGGVMRKNAGPAPVLDVATKRIRAATMANEGAPRGMISNPWVKHWSGTAAPPHAPAQAASLPPQPENKSARTPRGSTRKSRARRKATK